MDLDKDSDKQSEESNKLEDNVEHGSRPTSAEMRLQKSKKIINIHQFYPEIKTEAEDSLHLTLIDCVNEEDTEEEEEEEEDNSRPDSQLTHVTGDSPELDYETQLSRTKSSMYGFQFLWLVPKEADSSQKDNSESKDQQVTDGNEDVFSSTAVDEDIIEKAKERQGQTLKPETWTPNRPTLTMSKVINEKADEHFQMANERASKHHFEKAILSLNKAITLKPKVIDYYIMRAELFLQICDYQSAILNYKKVRSIDDNEEFNSRLAFIYYLQGQCLFDQRLFPEALESFAYASEMKPDKIGYSMRSIAGLAALNRHGECLALINKRLETEQDNADLYIMRARLHKMFRNFTLCFYDVKDALALNADHPEANKMMVDIKDKAIEAKYEALQLNVTKKYRDALQKISLAIEINPSVGDYHVLRGALHRHLLDFNSAIDDYLLALDKVDHNEESPIYKNAQRQLLLTYNDFAVECFQKGFNDEAIILLNKAIKGEKNEKGLYINRGDCFFKKNEIAFAMADYNQSLELDSTDLQSKGRISMIHNENGTNAYADKKYQDAESHFTDSIQYNPIVGRYFLSRAKARYMMENSSGARQDLLIGLLLEPSSDDMLSLMSRLFPGKSLIDVLQSRAADIARLVLNELVSTAMPGKIAPIPKPKPMHTAKDKSHDKDYSQTVAGSTWKPGNCFPDIRACMEEKEIHIKIAQEKKKINTKVKDQLHDRKSLKFTGGRIAAMRPHVEKQQVIPGPTSTQWKQFSLGIGVPTNLNV